MERVNDELLDVVLKSEITNYSHYFAKPSSVVYSSAIEACGWKGLVCSMVFLDSYSSMVVSSLTYLPVESSVSRTEVG